MPRITQAKLTEMRKLKAQGFTQREIAERVGCSRCSVIDYLRGKRTPGEAKVAQIAPKSCPVGTCPVCKIKATKLHPLHLNGDGVHRCPECAARWEAKRRGKAK